MLTLVIQHTCVMGPLVGTYRGCAGNGDLACNCGNTLYRAAVTDCYPCVCPGSGAAVVSYASALCASGKDFIDQGSLLVSVPIQTGHYNGLDVNVAIVVTAGPVMRTTTVFATQRDTLTVVSAQRDTTTITSMQKDTATVYISGSVSFFQTSSCVVAAITDLKSSIPPATTLGTDSCSAFTQGISRGAAAGVGIGSAVGALVFAGITLLFLSSRKRSWPPIMEQRDPDMGSPPEIMTVNEPVNSVRQSTLSAPNAGQLHYPSTTDQWRY